MYNNTITVFNMHEIKSEVTYYPTVIKGVDLNTDSAKILAKYGENSNDRAQLHIRYQKGCKVADKEYLTPKEWASGTDLENTITFTEGKDFFMEGEYPIDPVRDDEFITSKYTGFYDYLNSTKDHVFKISRVGKYDCIPHFEILGQ